MIMTMIMMMTMMILLLHTGNDDGSVAAGDRSRVENDVTLIASDVIRCHPRHVQRMIEKVECFGRR